jgi:hypothetical protein
MAEKDVSISTLEEKLVTLESGFAEVTKKYDTSEAENVSLREQLAVAKMSDEDKEAFALVPVEKRAVVITKCLAGEPSKTLAAAKLELAKSKQVPSEIQKRMDAQDLVIKSQAAEISKATAAVAKAKHDARVAELTILAKSDSEFGRLPAEPVKKAQLFKALEDKLTPEENTEVLRLFKAGNESITKGFYPVGSDRTDKDNSAEAQLEALTVAKMSEIKKGGNKITHAAAYSEVLNENPDLYSQYEAEKSTRVLQ